LVDGLLAQIIIKRTLLLKRELAQDLAGSMVNEQIGFPRLEDN
jgi:hypothetical protein